MPGTDESQTLVKSQRRLVGGVHAADHHVLVLLDGALDERLHQHRPHAAASLAGLAWGLSHGYLAIAFFLVTFTIGLRTVMTICAVALVDAMPENRTSLGAALNDTAQEVGTSVGTAVVGTLIAVLVTTVLPDGTWGADLVASFFHGEQIVYVVLAVVAGLLAGAGALTLSSSRSIEEPRSRQ